MTKITLIKRYRKTDVLSLIDVATVAESIIGGEYQNEVHELRNIYPILPKEQKDDDALSADSPFLKTIPRVCFASAMLNRQHRRQMTGYAGMVLLEVNNLSGLDEAAAIRQGCAQLPQTLLAFVGASGRSVKIVCRGVRVATDALPTEADETERFHLALYEKARMAYNMQLGVMVEKLEPRLDSECYVSSDAEAVYNPIAIPFYVDLSIPLSQHVAQTAAPSAADSTDTIWTTHRIFEFNLSKAYDEMAGIDEESADYLHQLTSVLAEQCQLTGIPIGTALHLTDYRLPFRTDYELVRLVFENVYRAAEEKKQRGRKPQVLPLRNVPAETLLAWKVRRFLNEHYDLRRNMMRGVIEYRQRNGFGFDFNDLTAEARNSMTLRALELGITCWDKDIRRYVESDDILPYEPISDYLERLPQWDGKDRVELLAQRVKTKYKAWPHLFHIWMRSMVAMWQGKGQLTGNALVPLLIGRQGCGKTSFCRILLPRHLREYYNDRISFKNEADLNLGLTSFALINLDEFDSVTQRQQVVLKYLLSTSNLTYRPPYGRAYRQHRRYASFIGTTNEPMPLTDPSGSRRFVVVQVEGDIDFATPVDHAQLYAQLYAEIKAGEPYWLSKDEELALMQHNRQYMQFNEVGDMVLQCYRPPKESEKGRWLTLKDIVSKLKQTFGASFREEPGTMKRIASFMLRPDAGFTRRRVSTGVEYLVVER
jgi:hypothetical protein